MSSSAAPVAARIAGPSVRPSRSVAAAVALGLVIAIGLAVGSVAAREPALALVGVVGLLAAVIVAGRPEAAALIVVGLIYSNAPVVFVTFHDVPLIIGASVPLVLAAPLAYEILIRRQKIVVTPALPWIVGYLLVQIVSTIASRDTGAAAAALGSFAIEGLALYILVTNTVRSAQVLRSVIWVLLLVGALLGALSLYQQLTETYGNAYFGFAQTESSATGVTETGLARLAGPIGEKNRYAQVMLMLVPLGVMMVGAERNRWLKVAALASAGLAAIATALTFSRGAALAAGIILLVMVAMRYVRVTHLLAAAGLIALVLIAVPQYGERVTSVTGLLSLITEDTPTSAADNSLLSRATENLTALSVWADHPLVGVGPGEFPAYYREYADEIGLSIRAQDREAHNLYLGIAAETGSLGLLTFVGAVGVTMWQLARVRRMAMKVRPDLAAMATGFLLALVGYLASGLFLHLSYARYYWLVLALAGAAAVIVGRATAAPEPERRGS
ncbi:MAG TPA: O-antigen ligase family protein [Candidatus Limnocylindrales bacterium]|nr:O-antigen ligase family protein [Candidatus Limnocylindrales bacterium]